MGKVASRTFTGSNMADWKAFFNGLNCSILTVSEEPAGSDTNNKLVLSIADVLTIKLGMPGNTLVQYPIYVIYGGITYGSNNATRMGGPMVALVAYSDTFFYLRITTSSHSTNYYNINVIYEEIDGVKYCGSVFERDWTVTGYPLESLTLQSMDDLSYFVHKAIIPYAVSVTYIEFSPTTYLFYNGGADIATVDDNLYSSSTVTVRQVLTFDSKNFYSLGTNSLFPMDD